MKCLVVDDDPVIRKGLSLLLEGQGCEVRQAAAGDEALARLAEQPADLVVTDIEMPGMDGVALLREIRLRWPDTGVVMVTGQTDVRTAVACLDQGALDYISKPFQIEEARARIAQAMEKRTLIEANRDYQRHLEERVREQAERIRELSVVAVQALAHALEAKDAYTRGHSSRVCAYSDAIARELGLSQHQRQELRIGAELHDIGKIGVREVVLLKPARLTEAEYEHIKLHPVIGERILRPLLGQHPEALAVVRSHHERQDGSGFPDGLAGEAVPVVARIAAAADTFDAMTSARPYREAKPAAQACEELRRIAGSQLDAEVVEAFLTAYPDPAALPIATPGRPAFRTGESSGRRDGPSRRRR
jgi:response regulator RpfG family c-di-GMP phosphodiesterase